MSKTRVAAIPAPTDANLREVARAVKNVLDVREGLLGDPLDSNVTFRDLVDGGIVTVSTVARRPGSGTGSTVVVAPPTATDGYDPTTDLTPPPAPSGFTATGMFSAVALSWLLPDIPNYAYTEIWRHNTDAIGDAVLIGTTSTNGYIDYIGNAVTRYYWVRFVTQANVTGPYNATAGTAGTTSQDPAYLLTILNGQISTSELNAALNTRIDLIDGSGAGSVNARIAAEAAARAQAITDEQTARAAAISAEAVVRNSQIALEVADRQAAITAEASARTAAILVETNNRVAAVQAANNAITQEVADRQAAISSEAATRTTAIQAEATARASAILAETNARVDAISIESHQRLISVQDAAEAALQAVVAVDTERTSRLSDVALARQELSYDLQVGLSAEASARLILTSRIGAAEAAILTEQTTRANADSALSSSLSVVTANVASNAAAIIAEATARSNADSALASDISLVSSNVASNAAAILSEAATRANADSALASDITTLFTSVGNNAAAIANEATARAAGDSAEATNRNTLAAQLRGSYTGSDLSQLASGLLYQERIARISNDNSLAQQITLLSAGAGEQFDWKKIWYFDDGVEGWSGNGTPTIANGFLRPANQASEAYVFSPTGIASDGNQYGQVRLRIRKTGSPTFAGYLWWRTSGDSTWDTARRVALTAPTFDANGIGLVTVTPSWSVVVDRVRIDLSDAQTATDYFEIDWVAIGRPAPGASSAQLLEEQVARASADAAETTARQILSSSLIGQTDASGVTLSGLTAGLLFDERQARSTADSSIASSVTSLQTTVTNNYSTLDAAIASEQTARSNADSALSSSINSLTTTVTNNYNTLNSAITTEQTARSDADAALTSSISSLTSTVTNNYNTLDAAITSEQTTRANADTALTSSITALTSTVTGNYNTLNAAITAEQSTRASEDTALASSISSLSTTVNNNYTTLEGAIAAEATARTNADSAEVTSRQALAAAVLGQNDPAGLTLATLSSGLIYDERTARVTADSAISTSVTTLNSTVNGLTSTVSSIQETIADLEATSSSDITLLVSEGRQLRRDVDQSGESLLRNVLSTDAERVARLGSVAAAKEELYTKVQEDVAAEAGQRLLLAARVNSNEAAITAEAVARATADSALSSQITTLTATTGSNTAAIVAETTARTNADSALSSSISTLTAQVASNTSALSVEQTVRADADSALSSSITALSSTVAGNTAAIATEVTTRANADSALSSQITALTADVADNEAAILSEATARATADAALTTSITSLTSTVNGNTAAIATEATTRANADSALSSSITALTSTVNSNTAAIATEATTRADADSALSQQITTLSTSVSNNAAAIQTEATARADADSALSQSITTLETTVGENTTAIETNAESIDGVRAMYTVKIDNNGVLSGFGLTSTIADGGSVTSKFLVSADQFAVIAPNRTAGQLNSVPFAVLTTQQTINGVTFQPGVYIDGASINDGTVSKAKIGSVDADTIQAGFMQTVDFSGSTIWGSEMFIGGTVTYEYNYPGQPDRITGIASIANPNIALTQSGAEFNVGYFKIRNGNSLVVPFEVSDSVVRIKTAVIGDGTITSAKIADSIQSTNYAAGTAGWKIAKDGAAEFFNVTVRGDVQATSLNAATGTFAGALSAATGTFSGSLSAADGTFAGTLSAAKISVGTSQNAVAFEDPAQAAISLRSIATGVFTFNGNAAIATSVPQTCYDPESGQPYDCSYFVYSAAPVTSNDLLFTTNVSGTPISRRLRTGNVRFLVIASATVDHYFSTWYRIWTNGVAGAWVNISEAVEPQSNYGSVSSNSVIEVSLTLGQAIQFGMAPANSSMVFWNSNATDIRYGSLSVIAVNF